MRKSTKLVLFASFQLSERIVIASATSDAGREVAVLVDPKIGALKSPSTYSGRPVATVSPFAGSCAPLTTRTAPSVVADGVRLSTT